MLTSLVASLVLAGAPTVGVVSAYTFSEDTSGLFSPGGRAGVALYTTRVEFTGSVAFSRVRVHLCDEKAKKPHRWDVNYSSRKPKDISPLVVELDTPLNAQSLYLSAEGTCVKQLELLDASGNAIPLVLPKTVAATVTASSVLDPALQYGPERAFDDNLTMAWSTHGDGTGQHLTVAFAAPVELSELRFAAGYWRSAEHAAANSRPKALSVSADGKKLAELTTQAFVNGRTALDTIKLPTPTTAKTWEVAITAIAPGTKYRDTLISDIQLFDGPQRVMVDLAPFRAKAKTDLDAKLAPTTWTAPFFDQTLWSSDDQPVGPWDACTATMQLVLSYDGAISMSGNRSCNKDLPGGYAFTSGGEFTFDGGFTLKKARAGCATIEGVGIYSESTCPDPGGMKPNPDADSSAGCQDAPKRIATSSFEVCSPDHGRSFRLKMLSGPIQFYEPDNTTRTATVEIDHVSKKH